MYFAIFCVLSLVLLAYYYLDRKNRYWEDRGVPFVQPKLLVGNMSGAGSKLPVGMRVKECHDELKGKGPLGGIFFFTSPTAIITDLDLLRNVLVRDFQHFHDRKAYVNERDDPLSGHLFSLPGEPWKVLRRKLTPTFTSGRMKMMYPTVINVANQFADNLKKLANGKRTEMELKELFRQFTTDVIGNVAFGLDCQNITNPDSEFGVIGRKCFTPSRKTILKGMLVTFFPKISKALRLAFTDPEITNFFMGIVADTIKHREENDVKRDDFMNLLLQLKNNGRLDGDNEEQESGKLTFNEVAAQAFLFFLAGFETSSSTMTFALYSLALHPEIQERAREELKDVMKKHGGELTYEAAMDLKYIDQIIHETLRMYPIFSALSRETTIDYKVPNSNVVLEKGTGIMVSALGIHWDPEIYPEPEKFDPERFTKENIAERHPFAYIPFGLGPRNCIGMRFGMMQTRLGIAAILQHFRVSPSGQTLIPMKFCPKSMFLSPEGGMNLNIEPIG